MIENKIDGRVPSIEKKKFHDLNDTKLMNLASRIEEIYKAINKSTDQFKPVNLPELTSARAIKTDVNYKTF